MRRSMSPLLPLIALATGFAATLLFYSLFLSLYWSRRTAIEQRTLLDNNGDTVVSLTEAPSSDSQSGIAPYLGVGLAIPVVDKLTVTADYRQTQLESENFGTFGIGLRFTN